MDIRRREHREAAVVVLEVVPVEEVLAEASSVLRGAEAVREVRPVLQRLELALRVRVVVRDVGSRVGLRDAQIGEQQPAYRRVTFFRAFDPGKTSSSTRRSVSSNGSAFPSMCSRSASFIIVW